MIKFRELMDTEDDYLLMTKWLNNFNVRTWYGFDDFINPPDVNDIKMKYRNKIINKEKMNPLIIIIDGIEAGYIQYYESREYLDEKDVYAIDLFIGNDDYRGKGYGTKVLREIINLILARQGAKEIIIDPDINNIAAIKCYTAAGFNKLKVIDNQLIMVFKP